MNGIPRKSPRKALPVSASAWPWATCTRRSVTPCVFTDIFIKYLLSILLLFIILIWASKVGKAFDAQLMWCKIKWDVRQCNESIATISGFTTHIDCLIFGPILSWFLTSYWLILLSYDWLYLKWWAREGSIWITSLIHVFMCIYAGSLRTQSS